MAESDVRKWMSEPLKIGVIGNSGVGKSSFINAIRGLQARDTGAAKVGITETTIEPTEYLHPKHKNLAFWDLPGMGTPKFPRVSYMTDIKFETYDFFLVLSATRFTENDKFLAEQIDRAKKKMYFVRTKIDIALREQQFDYPADYDEKASLETIRKDCSEKLGSLRSHIKIFLVSSRHAMSWGFPLLIENLVSDFPSLKRESIILSLTYSSSNIIKKKKEVLERRISKIATTAAVGNIIPLLGAAVNAALLTGEIELYKEQFGIDDTSLNKNGICSTELRQQYLPYMCGRGLNPETLFTEEAKIGVSNFLNFIPVLGQVISAGVAYDASTKLLRQYLEWCEADALSVSKYLIEREL